MPAERYYFEGNLKSSNTVKFVDQEYHHLVHVMRTREGDVIDIVNGRGVLASAQIDKIDKKEVYATILEVTEFPKESREIILAQAQPRSNRLDFILEKGTELGVTQIWLFPGERSERKEFSPSQLKRAQGILIAAMKQCGRVWLPQIVEKPPIKQWKSTEFISFFGDVSPGVKPFMEVLREKNIDDGVIFFVGPESGFSENELSQFQRLGVVGVKLHDNILRTDTASLVALSILSQ